MLPQSIPAPLRFICIVCKLLRGVFVTCIWSVHGSPLPAQSTPNPTVSSNPLSDRSSKFQVLADGSQDLAALVGLFATDGVERYGIDYTRGLVPPIMATLSLLGLLGYVRVLLKLSLGVEFCERTGFPTISLRSFAGVGNNPSARGENTVKTYYLLRSISKDSVAWTIEKTALHTQESMPLTVGAGLLAPQDRRPDDPSFSIAMCCLDKRKGTAALAFGLGVVSLAITTSISGSIILLLSMSNWSWTRLYASFGLTISVCLGGLPWCLVYIIEHLPFEPSDYYRSDWQGGRTSITQDPGQSLRRKNTLAFFAKEDQFYIFDCRAVSVSHMRVIRAISLVAAVSITIAYICQYIELRMTSAKASGMWLGTQGFLALIRISAWHWAPNIFGFNNSSFANTIMRRTDLRDNYFKDSLTELEITLCWASIPTKLSTSYKEAPSENQECSQALVMPVWLVEHIDFTKLSESFQLSNRLRMGENQAEDLYSLQTASAFWDMPDYLFARWLQLRCRSCDHSVQYTSSKRHKGVGAWVCRIVEDRSGRLHILPGISLSINDSAQSSIPSQVIFFTSCESSDSDILYFPSSGLPNGALFPYRKISKLHDDGSAKAEKNLAGQALRPFYREITLELWAELLAALEALGLAKGPRNVDDQRSTWER